LICKTDADADSGYVVLTSDGGHTWEEKATGTSHRLNAICFADQHSGWVVGNNGTIMATGDGGSTWTSQVSGTTSALNDVCFTDSENGWIVGRYNTIIHTNDGGNNWIVDSAGGNLYLSSVCFVDPFNGWIAGGGGTILHTADGGLTWEDQYTGGSGFSSIYFTDLNNGWVVGGHGCRYRTTDGGSTWIYKGKSAPSLATSSLESVYFTDPMNGWAVGWTSGGPFGSPSGILFMSTNDGGINWEDVPFPTSSGLYGITAVDPQNAWAVGRNGIIISTSDLMVGMQEDFPPDYQDGANDSGALSLNIYPNPVNRITNIEYHIPVGSRQWAVGSNVALSVFDVHGKEIIILVNEQQPSGAYTVRFDASDLPAGIYFIRFQSGDQTVVEKIIK